MERRETKTIAAAMPELAGKTIAVPETRELDVMAQLFEQRGATVIRVLSWPSSMLPTQRQSRRGWDGSSPEHAMIWSYSLGKGKA